MPCLDFTRGDLREAAGAVEAADLADLDEADMKEMGTYSAKYFS